MADPPLSRRQFLGAAVVAAGVAPSSALGPAEPTLLRPPFPASLAPEPPLPPGVARQFGSTRFRGRGGERFSADGRWLLSYAEHHCTGYELPTARWIDFRTTLEPGWTIAHWVPTTDGRLMTIEKQGNPPEATRVRRFHLPDGVETHRPVAIKSGEAAAISADGRVVVIDGLLAEGRDGCWGLHLGTDGLAWVWDDQLPYPLDPSGRFGTVGAFIHQGFANAHPKLIHLATGRRVKLQPAADDLFITVEEQPAVVSADGSRLAAWVKQPDRNWRQRLAVWDTRTGTLVASLPGEDGETSADVSTANLTADGRGWYGVDGDDRQLVMRELGTRKIVRRLPVFDANSGSLSPDGRTLLVGRRDRSNPDGRLPDNTMLRLIDADTGAVLPQSPDPPGPVTRVWFPNPTAAAAAYRTRVGHLDYVRWDTATGRGKRVTDPTDRNEPARTADPDPVPLVSPDLTHFLRQVGTQLVVLRGSAGDVVARCEPLPTANGRWFWLDPATVGFFNPDGLHLWAWAAGTTRVVPLELPGKWPHVWRWRASVDGKTLAVQFFPNLTGRACQVGWVEVGTGKVSVSDLGSNVSGEGFTASADAGRVALLVGKEVFHVHDRSGWRGVFRTDRVHKSFDLTACGRSLAVQCYTDTDDVGQLENPSLQLWEAVSGQRRWRRAIDGPFDDLRGSPCGRFVATCRADQPVYLWDVFGGTSDPHPEPTADDWAALGSADAGEAFRAVRRLVQHPASAVTILSAKLKPAVAPKAAWVDERVERLGDPDFHTRQAAERELSAVGDVVLDRLRAAAEAGVETEEAAERLERVLTRAVSPAVHLRTVRAVEALEYAGEAASPLLARLANGAPGLLSREATAAKRRADAVAGRYNPRS